MPKTYIFQAHPVYLKVRTLPYTLKGYEMIIVNFGNDM
jgi:hypothetical protein